jgi:hypothetical protein
LTFRAASRGGSATTLSSRPRLLRSDGLYIALPEKTIVLGVDKKPSIQALERSQGYLKLPNGRALIAQSYDYKRHGTTTLFAALDLESGKVVGKHYKRRRSVEFLDFMNKVVAAYPGKEKRTSTFAAF